jgi:hypothetical protein
VTFTTGEVATRLVDREIIFRSGELDGRDESSKTIVCLLKGRFAGKGLSSFDFDETTSLRISLFNQIAFHFNYLKILSYAITPLQENIGL